MAALVGMAGMDPMVFLTSRDPLEVLVMQQIARRHQDLCEQRDERLAVLIANAVGKAFNG